MTDHHPPDATDRWVTPPQWNGWAPASVPPPPPTPPRNPAPLIVAAGVVAIVALAVGLVVLGGDGSPRATDTAARSANAAGDADDDGTTTTASTLPDLTFEPTIPGGEAPEDAAGPSFDDDGLATATREQFVANLERMYETDMATCIADELFAHAEQETLDRLAAIPFAELTSLERAVANNAVLACARSVWGMPDG